MKSRSHAIFHRASRVLPTRVRCSAMCYHTPARNPTHVNTATSALRRQHICTRTRSCIWDVTRTCVRTARKSLPARRGCVITICRRTCWGRIRLCVSYPVAVLLFTLCLICACMSAHTPQHRCIRATRVALTSRTRAVCVSIRPYIAPRWSAASGSRGTIQ